MGRSKFLYLLTLVLMWVGYISSLILLMEWEFFKAVVLVFLAVGEAFFALSLLLLSKAVKTQG